MTNVQTCSLQLQRNPDQGRAIPCSVHNLPLLEANDYARRDAYVHYNPVPVLVNHRQYYALLSQLVKQAWDRLGSQTRVLLQMRLPSLDLALPTNLLDPRVTLGAYLWAEALLWARQGTPVVWISTEHIRRDLWDRGDNRLQIATWNTPQAPSVEAHFLPVLADFDATRITRPSSHRRLSVQP
ncbi:hypothetical protein [Pseudomonas chlororaphis]|jgi:hypothetical protein|uniref:hypothetical protein n=1 Tax=Pseudomonas chlororaphis TaxID=587753 RepID=UPI0015DE931F|nr:hypothetical protein [Pseudomonas chlororaphis]QLL12559.1 hypothetical protein H0I86_26785 [Pseudomonas chlororaphis subsp. aurantiaca]